MSGIGDQVVVIFDGTISRNRVSHILKISKILSGLGKKIIVSISRIDKKAIMDIIENKSDIGDIFVLDTKHPLVKNGKYYLAKELILQLVQLLRLRRKLCANANKFIVMGTLNLSALVVFRFCSKNVYVFAGGFAYTSDISRSLNYRGSRNIINFVKSYIIYLIESIIIFLANYLIIESKYIRKYIPFSHKLRGILNRKVMDYGSLFVDADLFKIWVPIDEREDVVGYIGSLEPYRAIVQLVLAFKIVARVRPNAKFLIIGSGSLYDKVYKLINDDPELKSRTTLLGYVPYTDIPDYLNRIKVLVFLTESEGLPNTILEALACGCVVLTTPVGGIPDVIKEDIRGFYVTSLHPKDIAMRIIQVLDMPKDTFRSISLRGHTFVKEYYTFEYTLKKWGHILGE
jgi:glycosyltransferase involved in cell wall biosynthesis